MLIKYTVGLRSVVRRGLLFSLHVWVRFLKSILGNAASILCCVACFKKKFLRKFTVLRSPFKYKRVRDQLKVERLSAKLSTHLTVNNQFLASKRARFICAFFEVSMHKCFEATLGASVVIKRAIVKN